MQLCALDGVKAGLLLEARRRAQDAGASVDILPAEGAGAGGRVYGGRMGDSCPQRKATSDPTPPQVYFFVSERVDEGVVQVCKTVVIYIG